MQWKAPELMSSEVATTNRNIRRGIVGTVIVLTFVLGSVIGMTALPGLGGRTQTAYLSEAGGLAKGDDVVTSGLVVGRVGSVTLDGNRVEVRFKVTDADVRLGSRTTAAVITRTVLGRRVLEVTPAGPGTLDRPIPLGRTRPPYDVTAALSDLTTTVGQVDDAQLARSLEVTGGMLASVAPDVAPALDGIGRLSDVVARRDADLRALVESAARVSGTLGNRAVELQQLLSAGAGLLEAVDGRRVALERLLTSAGEASAQIAGLIRDNDAQTAPALAELNRLLAKLNANRAGIAHGLKSAGPLLRELGEVVSAFPGFNVYIPNMVATNLVPTLPELFGADGAR